MAAKKETPTKETTSEKPTQAKSASSSGGGFAMFFITWLVLAAVAYGGYVVWMQMKVQQAKFEATLEQIATTQEKQQAQSGNAALERSTEELKESLKNVKSELAETFEKAADVVQQRSVEMGTQLLDRLSDKLSGLQDRLENAPQAPAKEPVIVKQSTDNLLLQAVLNIRQSYQQGRMNRTDLQLAYVLAEDAGDVDAITLLTELELLLEDGVMTQDALVHDLWALVDAQPKDAPETEAPNTPSTGFWDDVGQRLSNVVRVRKIEDTPNNASNNDTATLIEALLQQGDYDDAIDTLDALNVDDDSRDMLAGHIAHVAETEAAFDALYRHLRQRDLDT